MGGPEREFTLSQALPCIGEPGIENHALITERRISDRVFFRIVRRPGIGVEQRIGGHLNAVREDRFVEEEEPQNEV